ncbi:MAG: hypothetical protein Ct9H300mP12_15120 [Acidimicrobiales bacterium]|nr:MAG: hypothetical protein Ct9H300mP12_15120 [Acidimicrobiales bacterium]
MGVGGPRRRAAATVGGLLARLPERSVVRTMVRQILVAGGACLATYFIGGLLGGQWTDWAPIKFGKAGLEGIHEDSVALAVGMRPSSWSAGSSNPSDPAKRRCDR